MFNKLTTYFRESFQEFGKVTWPTKNQAIILCVVVFVVCLVLAALLAVLDYGFGLGISELIKYAEIN